MYRQDCVPIYVDDIIELHWHDCIEITMSYKILPTKLSNLLTVFNFNPQ